MEGAALRPGGLGQALRQPGGLGGARPASGAFQSPIAYTPGRRTPENLLCTALQPVGTTLMSTAAAGTGRIMVRADSQWTGASSKAGTHFLERWGPNYCYRREQGGPDWSPWGNYNQYYYAGADCSGYLGWVLRQVLGTAALSHRPRAWPAGWRSGGGLAPGAGRRGEGFSSGGYCQHPEPCLALPRDV